ncbi:hypothetical protein ACF8PL_26915 [Delftia sp. WSY_4]|uniref:hypothetical protein n=1 Tax=unclassified Delftia TaxID=2613839 RepID=UPI00370BDBAB
MADDTVQDRPPVFEDTPHLGLPLPHPDNTLEVDNPRLREALGMLDQVAHDMGQAIEASASQEALHSLAQATGQAIDQLQQQTELALEQQGQRLDQLAQEIDDKSVDLQSVMQATNAEQARAGQTLLERLRHTYVDSATNGQALQAGVAYLLKADAAYSRALPAAPERGDTIVLLDPWGLWRLGLITITRANALHEINRRKEDLILDYNCWHIRLVYAGENLWLLSMGQDTGGNP